MHLPSFIDISMVIYHYGAIAARGSEGVNTYICFTEFLESGPVEYIGVIQAYKDWVFFYAILANCPIQEQCALLHKG